MPAEGHNQWQEQDLEQAVQIALKKDNTNFESLIKNLENNAELYDLIFKSIMGDNWITYNIDNPVIKVGVLYGILKEENGRAKVHNRLYEQRIYNYMASKMETSAVDIVNIGGKPSLPPGYNPHRESLKLQDDRSSSRSFFELSVCARGKKIY